MHADVENAIALALYRRYEPAERSPENTRAPERLHVWGTRSGGEIDFVCGPRDAIEAVEVADWNRLNRQKATAPMRALPGRPAIVATRHELEFGPAANLVPAALVLWALFELVLDQRALNCDSSVEPRTEVVSDSPPVMAMATSSK